MAGTGNRWLALYILCLGVLMMVLDTTIVNVALPSIRDDLGFGESSLAWVMNAYMLTFGGFLLLGGRLGDLFGAKRLFLIGIVLFTAASLACGLAGSQLMLIAARAVQGIGGAISSAVGLSLVMSLFPEQQDRAKAMGVYSFVASAGGSVGLLLGGFLTGSFDWHWAFLVNIPVGFLVLLLCWRLLPSGERKHGKVDVAGAATVTASLMLAVYAIVNGNQAGWTSVRTLGMLGGAAALLAAFLVIETRVRTPLMPLTLFRQRNFTVANTAGMLWASGMFSWFFLSALYLQLVLGYTPMQVGLSFLPCNLIMAAFSLGLSARIVMRFGIKPSLTAGLALVTLGLLWFARAPVDGTYVLDVLPSMIFFGLGAGTAFNPMLLAAMGDVSQEDSGLASGMVNTAFMMGGSLGLAILASVAALRTGGLLEAGTAQITALTGGYHAAFLLGAGFTALATVLVLALLRPKEMQPGEAPQAMH